MLSKSAVFAAVTLSQALPALALAVVHERLTTLPQGWTATSVADEGSVVSFTVALTLQNIDQLESKLLAVSTSGSSNYDQYLNDDELNTLFAPTAGSSSAVEEWLKSQIAADGAYVTFSTTVGTANSLLGTTFKKYEKGGVSKIRTSEYSIPEDLVDYVELIDPTVFLGSITASVPTSTRKTADAPTKRSIDAACSTSITPTCLKELYNTVGYTPDPKSGSRVGFGSFLNESAIYSDLFKFEEYFDIPRQNFSTVLIDGATNNQDIATAEFSEANLDVQCIIGISHPLPVTEFITAGSPPFIPNLDIPTAADNQNEPYLPYYQYLLSQPTSSLPQVISNSYGDDEQTVPEKYAIKVCTQIGLMGLRGITVLESSGDNGVGGPCQSNDGNKTAEFTPQFPGTCPYITAVGGNCVCQPRGGLELAVESYLNSEISSSVKEYYEPLTNFKGRVFPDISAHSVSPNYQVVYGGELAPSGGTSAAAPVTATIIGQSIGCNGVSTQSGKVIPGASIISWATWNATAGWDPVTGLGTPDFAKLKAILLKV